MGIPGELNLGGVGLACGYLDRPGLTGERFIPDPFTASGSAPGARLYRTGDLVRSAADGSLEFLGPLDHQVKQRGFRIELGEIENALLTFEQIREAIVLLRKDMPGPPQLVAYLTP